MTEALMNAIKSKRILRMSLRSSVILVTVLSCLLAYWAAGARRNRVAIESVLRHGGQVEFWHNVVDSDPQYFSVTSRDPSTPAWLRKRLGDEWFVSVVGVSFGKGSRDEDVARLLGLRRLWLIDGDLSSVTDDGVRSLARLGSLRRLRLNDNLRITDDGVRSLATLKNLWELELECTNISSRGLRDTPTTPGARPVCGDWGKAWRQWLIPSLERMGASPDRGGSLRTRNKMVATGWIFIPARACRFARRDSESRVGSPVRHVGRFRFRGSDPLNRRDSHAVI